jgi:hypothetical protein
MSASQLGMTNNKSVSAFSSMLFFSSIIVCGGLFPMDTIGWCFSGVLILGKNYYLVCMHCGERLTVGEAVKVRDPRLQQDIHCFSMITDNHDDGLHKWPEAELNKLRMRWRYTAHFLMRHRGHEIRALPEKLITGFESETFPHIPPAEKAVIDGAAEENYYLTPTGVPDQLKDAALMRDSVEWRLKELRQGINMATPVWDDED